MICLTFGTTWNESHLNRPPYLFCHEFGTSELYFHDFLNILGMSFGYVLALFLFLLIFLKHNSFHNC